MTMRKSGCVGYIGSAQAEMESGEFMGAIPIYPQEGKKKAERWNVIISMNRICLLLCP
jgi:hypothetical protein